MYSKSSFGNSAAQTRKPEYELAEMYKCMYVCVYS